MEDTAEKYSLVAHDDPAYKLLRDLVEKHHAHLAEAGIVLVYEHGIKKDVDGHLTWGRAKKVSPLEQQFHAHDFVILLNAEVWAKLPEKGKRPLLDHELCHCRVKTSEGGEKTYYIRKHDLEEFNEIARRYGLWRDSLEALVNAALGKEQNPLFPEPKPEEPELEPEDEAPKRRRKKVKAGA